MCSSSSYLLRSFLVKIKFFPFSSHPSSLGCPLLRASHGLPLRVIYLPVVPLAHYLLKLKEGYHVSSPFFNVVAAVEMELCHYDKPVFLMSDNWSCNVKCSLINDCSDQDCKMQLKMCDRVCQH